MFPLCAMCNNIYVWYLYNMLLSAAGLPLNTTTHMQLFSTTLAYINVFVSALHSCSISLSLPFIFDFISIYIFLCYLLRSIGHSCLIFHVFALFRSLLFFFLFFKCCYYCWFFFFFSLRSCSFLLWYTFDV